MQKSEIRTPQQANPEELQKYDLVGFGAGIDSGRRARWSFSNMDG